VLSTGAKALAKHCHRDSAVRVRRVPGIYVPLFRICVPLFMNYVVQWRCNSVGRRNHTVLPCISPSPLGADEPPCRRCRAEPSVLLRTALQAFWGAAVVGTEKQKNSLAATKAHARSCN
jgi:hypothetical protein